MRKKINLNNLLPAVIFFTIFADRFTYRAKAKYIFINQF